MRATHDAEADDLRPGASRCRTLGLPELTASAAAVQDRLGGFGSK
jgi:hypothetical protein